MSSELLTELLIGTFFWMFDYNLLSFQNVFWQIVAAPKFMPKVVKLESFMHQTSQNLNIRLGLGQARMAFQLVASLFKTLQHRSKKPYVYLQIRYTPSMLTSPSSGLSGQHLPFLCIGHKCAWLLSCSKYDMIGLQCWKIHCFGAQYAICVVCSLCPLNK